MRIVLIGNYKPDRQESMIRFTQMLCSGFQNAGFDADIWWPKIYFGRKQKTTIAGFGKWLGYIDKWLIFPLVLQKRLKNKAFESKEIHFHICDHSNSPYLKNLPSTTSITCHDVLAVKGSLGYKETYISASRFGKILQKWILHHLSRTKSIACVSQFTLSQLQELVQGRKVDQQNWRVIHNAFNADFKRYEHQECEVLLQKHLNLDIPFVLHVGSGHPRKNRKLLIDMLVALGDNWKGNVCFAGEGLETDLQTYIQQLKLNDRIVSIVGPDHYVLTALYSSCMAFIYPSFSEGFGWPLIEAQACGAPVISSDIEPMPEISGGAALHADPLDPNAFAKAFLHLQNKDVKEQFINKGYENCKRFDLKKMTQSYLNFFEVAKN